MHPKRTLSVTTQDMAVLTNGTVIAEDVGMKLETAEFSCLGTAKKGPPKM